MVESKKQHDQYVAIHTEVLEALMRIDLSPTETRILFAVWRKTYGFKDKTTGKPKKRDWISVSQFEQLTGLPRRSVTRALEGLVEKNIIERKNGVTGFSKNFMNQERKAIAERVRHLFSESNVKVDAGTESIAAIMKRKGAL